MNTTRKDAWTSAETSDTHEARRAHELATRWRNECGGELWSSFLGHVLSGSACAGSDADCGCCASSASGMGAALPLRSALGAFVLRPCVLLFFSFCISPPGKFIGLAGGIKTPATHFVAHKLNSLRPVCVLFSSSSPLQWQIIRKIAQGNSTSSSSSISSSEASAETSAGKVSQRGFLLNKVTRKVWKTHGKYELLKKTRDCVCALQSTERPHYSHYWRRHLATARRNYFS